METMKKFNTLPLIILLIMVFPVVIDLYGNGNAGGNHQAMMETVVNSKLTGVQVSPIVITSNSEFTAAGFSGSGTPETPYILKDISITSAGPPGINITDTDAHFRIVNVTVSGATDAPIGGINLKNVRNGKIINCTVTDSFGGYALMDSTDNVLEGNNATNNGYYGFGASTSSKNTLKNNIARSNNQYGFFLGMFNNETTLFGNNATGHVYGFVITTSCNNSLTGNLASGNSDKGFYLYGYSNNNTLTGNNATGNTNEGFYLEQSSNNTLTGNFARNNDFMGFALYDSHNNTLRENIITENFEGLYLDSSNNNTLIGNNATLNSVNGFFIWNSSNNTLIGNNATGNNGEGFNLVTTCNYNKLIGNHAEKNGGSGFDLYDDCYNNTLIGNNADGNTNLGFYLLSSSNNTLTGNTATGNDMAFYLEDSDNTTLTGNNATGQTYGFVLLVTNNNELTGNNASGNNNGFYLEDSHNNTLTGNEASGVTLDGFSLQSSHNNTLTGNTANGNNLGFDLYNSHNNTLTENTANNNLGLASGFYLWGSSNYNTLTGNTANWNVIHGFHLGSSSNNNTLTGNTASGNRYGFYLSGSSFNTLTGNDARDNVNKIPNGMSEGGFILTGGSHNNTLTGNYASENDNGFYFSGSSNNTLTGNAAIENKYRGIFLYDSDNNTLTGNTAYNNSGYGIQLSSLCDYNLVYLNFFINNSNTPQGYDQNLANSWDNGTHGNYWSDYTGTDDIGDDGIGEANYTLAGGQQVNDTRPLVPALLISLSTLQLTGPGDQIFEAGSTGILSLTWLPVTNIQVNTAYELYLDDGLEDSGNWTSGTAITLAVDLTGASPGDYNITLVISDYSNKTAAHTVWVTVEDTADPVITAPADFTEEAGPAAGTLVFSATDLFPATYVLYLNDGVNQTDNWTSGTVVTVQLDGFLPGDYNFTLVVVDTSGNEAKRTVLVTLEDTVDPVITPIGDLDVEAGPAAGTLVFSATDLFPDTYTLYLDDDVNQTDSWTSGTVVTVQLGSFLPGDYNFTLVVVDTSGNGATLTVLVTLEDTTDPVITYTGPDTFTFEAGSTGNTFTISATDLYPGNFTLYQNGTGIGTYNWTSGTVITVDLDELSLATGTYNFTLVVSDMSGNTDFMTVIVTVTTKTTSTTTPTTPTSSSSTTTTTGKPSPGWTAPFVLLYLACSAVILSRRRPKRKK
ncbi:MAG: NosD domain-containing protein [Candidatus Odinarchaeota archaeon]